MPQTSFNSSEGGGRRRRIIRGDRRLSRGHPTVPIGPITRLTWGLNHRQIERLSRTSIRVIPIPAQMRAIETRFLVKEVNKVMQDVQSPRLIQTARRALKKLARSIESSNPRQFYAPLNAFLNLQISAFTDLARIRQDFSRQLDAIRKEKDVHAMTKKEIDAQRTENEKILNQIKFVVWDIRNWQRIIQRNRKAIGSPHFSMEQFAKDRERAVDLFRSL